ncbi:MAG TPA: 50S ribosomal protein L24 [Thermoplasmata archaeon]|nr:50S ribosomal protein L24 [Thermoplasmata archaeon]
MSTSRSTQPRKQRRAAFNASPFERHRAMSVALSRELRGRYKRRALPLRKGDTVRIISGSFQGREERVSKVDMRSLRVTLDNVTTKKVDQKLKPLPIRSSHLILTRLNLADPWRRAILKVSAAEVPPEETTVPPPETAPAEPAPAPETPEAAPVGESEPVAEVPKKRKARPATQETE